MAHRRTPASSGNLQSAEAQGFAGPYLRYGGGTGGTDTTRWWGSVLFLTHSSGGSTTSDARADAAAGDAAAAGPPPPLLVLTDATHSGEHRPAAALLDTIEGWSFWRYDVELPLVAWQRPLTYQLQLDAGRCVLRGQGQGLGCGPHRSGGAREGRACLPAPPSPPTHRPPAPARRRRGHADVHLLAARRGAAHALGLLLLQWLQLQCAGGRARAAGSHLPLARPAAAALGLPAALPLGRRCAGRRRRGRRLALVVAASALAADARRAGQC